MKTSNQLNEDRASALSSYTQALPHSSKLVRAVYIVLALLCILLACIGIILPGVPTVDFLFLAAFFASKSSKRLHQWLYQHRLFGPLLNKYKNIRQMSVGYKLFISTSLIFSSAIIYFSELHQHLKLSLYVCIFAFIVWLWIKRK